MHTLLHAEVGLVTHDNPDRQTRDATLHPPRVVRSAQRVSHEPTPHSIQPQPRNPSAARGARGALALDRCSKARLAARSARQVSVSHAKSPSSESSRYLMRALEVPGCVRL